MTVFCFVGLLWAATETIHGLIAGSDANEVAIAFD
jgi:hypothetical protein